MYDGVRSIVLRCASEERFVQLDRFLLSRVFGVRSHRRFGEPLLTFSALDGIASLPQTVQPGRACPLAKSSICDARGYISSIISYRTATAVAAAASAPCTTLSAAWDFPYAFISCLTKIAPLGSKISRNGNLKKPVFRRGEREIHRPVAGQGSNEPSDIRRLGITEPGMVCFPRLRRAVPVVDSMLPAAVGHRGAGFCPLGLVLVYDFPTFSEGAQ